jgi:dihydroorotate dehydrogenase
MSLYSLARPLLFSLDPERAHRLALASLARISAHASLRRLVEARYALDTPELAVTVLGRTFSSCIGLGAGFDKDASVLPALGALGFGHVEIGTVTPLAQPGNQGVRLWRIREDEALFNWLGFNSAGAAAVADNLRAYRARFGGAGPAIGVNLGKNRETPVERATDDYVAGYRALFGFGDYFVVNVSSPNTPGLRTLQDSRLLDELVHALLEEAGTLSKASGRSAPPLLLKLSPDLGEADLEAAVDVALQRGAAGIVATNTSIQRDLVGGGRAPDKGGVSGRPITELSTRVVTSIRRQAGSRLPIIGVGGVFTGDDAFEKIRAGASLVQIHSGMIFRGPGIVRQVKQELSRRLRAEGLAHVSEAVGRAVDDLGPPVASGAAPTSGPIRRSAAV